MWVITSTKRDLRQTMKRSELINAWLDFKIRKSNHMSKLYHIPAEMFAKYVRDKCANSNIVGKGHAGWQWETTRRKL